MNTEPNLQLMFYDDSDVTSRLRQLQGLKELPANWTALDVNVPLGLTHSWFVGGALARAMNHIDLCQGHRVWYRALEWLAETKPEQKITEIQYWGHGSPGRVWMDGEALTTDVFDGPLKALLAKIKSRLTPEAVIWFRTCATFGAERGRAFARRWAQEMGCRVAAHTHNIGLFQSGLHSLRPGQAPGWSAGEGIRDGTTAVPLKMRPSGPFCPNTIPCLAMDLPREW